VIAVNTASAPRVSMVVQPPATQPADQSTETCSVTVDDDPVAATVTPLASADLSVALVIDTASDLTPQELAAVQRGAIDFLLQLPQGAHTMVVAAAGEPQVVAPLKPHAAEALSAIGALRAGGSPAATAGTRLAAQSLESAPPGPRVIIVYTRGSNEQDPSVEQLSEAVLQANAAINVIPTDTESIWPSVVDRTGGVVLPPTGAADVAQSYGRLATMLTEQYFVTFEAPGELPAVAQVAFQSGDQEYTTVVNLPDAGTEQAAPEQGTRSGAGGIVGLVALVGAGALTMLGVLVARRARGRQRAHDGEAPAELVTSTISATQPDQAAPGTPPNGQATPSGPRRPATVPAESRPARASLTAAVQGRRLARLTLDSQQAQRPGPADQESERAEPRRERNAPPRAQTALTGSGNEIVGLTKNLPGPVAVHISGNQASEHFAIRALGAQEHLVETADPYDGVRSLAWEGGDWTRLEVIATGPWRIEGMLRSALPTFDKSFNGKGDMVLHFTGDGSIAVITATSEGRNFQVRTLSPSGKYLSLVNTTAPYVGSCQIQPGPQFFEVRAAGPWTISIS
jgi:hypothetical protein